MKSAVAHDLSSNRMLAGEDGSMAVYVHWPFCLSKCPYCDFNSHVRSAIDEGAFVDMLCRELEHRADLARPRVITSIFFGGGTPSLMKPKSVAKILDRIAALWQQSADVEVTLEANPTSVEGQHFAGYRGAGVNRVSLGIQALDDRALKMLGREHSGKEALEALSLAARHFERFSFDLIYARPEQSETSWRDELKRALTFAGEHLSLYELTLEKGTPFYAAQRDGKFTPLDNDTAATLYEITQELCEEAGLPAYEISNHARPGSECRHNLNYWRYGEYAGVGPGAHGRLVVGGIREMQECLRGPEAWRDKVQGQGHGLSVRQTLTGEESAQEYLMMGLRLSEGVSLQRYEELGAKALLPERIAQLSGDGFVVLKDDRMTVSPKGRLVLNTLTGALLS